MRTRWLRLASVEICVDELIAEFALRVILLEQGLVGRHLWVEALEGCGRGGEEFCPMGTCVEGG